MLFLLKLLAIPLGGATTAFFFWQLNWATPFAVANLLVIAGWAALFAVLLFYSQMFGLAQLLAGAGPVPVWASAFVTLLIDQPTRMSWYMNLMGGLMVFLLFGFLAIFLYSGGRERALRKAPSG